MASSPLFQADLASMVGRVRTADGALVKPCWREGSAAERDQTASPDASELPEAGPGATARLHFVWNDRRWLRAENYRVRGRSSTRGNPGKEADKSAARIPVRALPQLAAIRFGSAHSECALPAVHAFSTVTCNQPGKARSSLATPLSPR